jgi:UDP-N-acetyl-D-galactosamine dehydrogenase
VLLIVDVYDPFANAEAVFEEYKIKLVSEIEKYDAIILAVAHDSFLKLDFENLKKDEQSIIFDIKSILPKNIVDARL